MSARLESVAFLSTGSESLSEATLAALRGLCADPATSSVSYAGDARSEVLRLLCEEQARRESPTSKGLAAFPLYILDLSNRYGASTEFDWDTSERMHACRFPDWMRDAVGKARVMFSEEGVGPGTLLILDLPEHMARRVTKSYPRGRSVVVLLGEARFIGPLIDQFEWTVADEALIGQQPSR